jgi:hypothetical protein
MRRRKSRRLRGRFLKRKATEKLLGEYDLSKYNPKKPTFGSVPTGGEWRI